MLALINALVPIYVGELDGNMGPGRHSLRLAAQSLAGNSGSTAARDLVTPRVSSKISKAKLKQLATLKVEKVSERESSSDKVDEKHAYEEFHSGAQVPQLEGIKRKLNFDLKSLSMNGLTPRPDPPSILGSFKAKKVRAEAHSGKVDDIVKGQQNVVTKVPSKSTQAKKPRKRGRGYEEVDVHLKQEPQDGADLQTKVCAARIEEGQREDEHTEVTDVVKAEARDQAGSRRRKLVKNVFAGVANVNKWKRNEVEKAMNDTNVKKSQVLVKLEPQEEGVPQRRRVAMNASVRVPQIKKEVQDDQVQRNIDDAVKQEVPEQPTWHKKKLPKKVSAKATPAKDSKQQDSTNEVKTTPLQLELVRVRPGRGAQLASARASAIITLPGPYPSYARPFPEECQKAKDLLSALHGELPEYERHKKSCPGIGPSSVQVSSSRELNKPRILLGCAGNSGPEERDKNRSMPLALTVIDPSAQDDGWKAVVSTRHPRKRGTVLDSLVGTLLSQNTTDNNSRRAFTALKSAFPTWEEVLRAKPQEVEDAIRCGGLAEIKAGRIRNILDTLLKERGEICMEYLRSMSNEDIKLELSRFKGVGPKTVACVLMFHLQRDEFPVDTHVFRITKMLGWVPQNADREKAYLHLNQRIPDLLKFDLHCLFVTHGRRCPHCAKRTNRQPADGPCPLVNWTVSRSKNNSAIASQELACA